MARGYKPPPTRFHFSWPRDGENDQRRRSDGRLDTVPNLTQPSSEYRRGRPSRAPVSPCRSRPFVFLLSALILRLRSRRDEQRRRPCTGLRAAQSLRRHGMRAHDPGGASRGLGSSRTRARRRGTNKRNTTTRFTSLVRSPSLRTDTRAHACHFHVRRVVDRLQTASARYPLARAPIVWRRLGVD